MAKVTLCEMGTTYVSTGKPLVRFKAALIVALIHALSLCLTPSKRLTTNGRPAPGQEHFGRLSYRFRTNTTGRKGNFKTLRLIDIY